MGQFWNMAIVTVLDVPGPPNFAGTLVRSIPTQFNRFWDISGTLKKLFIFVHSFHSGASFRATKRQVLFILSLPIIFNQQKSPKHELKAQITVPSFVPKIWVLRRKVGTVLEHGHCDGSRRARASKLCRDTC